MRGQLLVRQLIGDQLRRARLAQNRTLREVSTGARVSLGYLSEVERGQKEASSELLASICASLKVPLSTVLRGVGDDLAAWEQELAQSLAIVDIADVAEFPRRTEVMPVRVPTPADGPVDLAA
jgi:transcriptional regulator with XRE-family HTH domain